MGHSFALSIESVCRVDTDCLGVIVLLIRLQWCLQLEGKLCVYLCVPVYVVVLQCREMSRESYLQRHRHAKFLKLHPLSLSLALSAFLSVSL